MGLLVVNSNATPSTPASGYSVIYPKSDGKWYFKDDAGVEHQFLPADLFESSDLTIAFNSLHSATHGLGAKPKRYSATIRCTTAQLGYSIGDEIDVSNATANGTPATGSGLSVNTTTIYYAASNQIVIARKDTFAMSNITVADWTLVLRAWLN